MHEKREGRLHCGCSTCLSMCTQKWVVNQKQVIKPYWYHFNKADVCRSSLSSLVKVPAGIDYSKSTLFMSIMVFFYAYIIFLTNVNCTHSMHISLKPPLLDAKLGPHRCITATLPLGTKGMMG